MGDEAQKCLIQKKIISPGQKFIPMTPGTRVKFHYKTIKTSDGTVIDDSKEINKPMELVLGKKFKLEVWESAIQVMSLNELAKFTVDKSMVRDYPFVSKALRDSHLKPCERKHCCAMILKQKGLGYKDLDDLLENPSDLEFIIDLFSIELPEQYEKGAWQMSDKEKLKAATELRTKGNLLFKENKINEAEQCYHQAVAMIEDLMLKEKPHDNEWLQLAHLKIPVLLNYVQCRLMNEDYYSVIEHCTEILILEPNNVKALFRRAKAHFGAWNPIDARLDFEKAAKLDSSLQNVVQNELRKIDNVEKKLDKEEKVKFQNLFK